jgi:hypothetical protein
MKNRNQTQPRADPLEEMRMKEAVNLYNAYVKKQKNPFY